LYYEGDQSYSLSNSGLNYGSLFAKALEIGEDTGDLLTDVALDLLPKYNVRDKEIVVDMKTVGGAVTLLGRPDMLDDETFAFREVKTGKVKWNQKKADKHLQLKIYAVLIYLTKKVVPPSVYLDWVETFQDTDGEVTPTGHIESFKVDITLKDILETMALISKVAKEIELDWASYVPEPVTPF
jgi:hypothetical protein